MEAALTSTLHSDYFTRQINLPGVGDDGQKRLARSKVLIVGMGGLGNPASQALLLAGVNQLTFMDGDIIEYTNLHRQPLFTPSDLGENKAECAARKLALLRPAIEITVIKRFLRGTAADRELIGGHDLVIDATDIFSAKYLLHDACLAMRQTLVSASVSGFTGQLHVFPFRRKRDICLRCLYPVAPADGSTGTAQSNGLFGAAPQIMGNLEAMTALRLLLDLPGPQPFSTHQFDLASGTISRFSWPAAPGCIHETPEKIPLG